MSAIKNVAVIGGSGNLGPHIVKGLQDASFSVTALTRESSNSTFPDSVAVKKVNFDSSDSIKDALQGQDAVVSVVASAAVGAQKLIVDAAVAAGVKRYIPSEFGINTLIVPGTTIGKILAGKVAVREHLEQKAKENPNFTWTGISTGIFFDWTLERFFGIDPKAKKATVVDSGNEVFYASNLAFIGRAVAAVLQHPDQTANKYIFTASFNTSQGEVVKIVEELIGSKIEVSSESSTELQKTGEDKLAKGDYSAFVELVRVWNYADGAGHALKFEDNASKVLELPAENPKVAIKAWLEKAGVL